MRFDVPLRNTADSTAQRDASGNANNEELVANFRGSSLISYFTYISFFVSYFERSILGTILEAEVGGYYSSDNTRQPSPYRERVVADVRLFTTLPVYLHV